MSKNLNENLQWFGSSLGLFNLRDKDKSCFRIFIELVKASKKGEGLKSDEIADRAKLSRGTVVHHLHKLIEAGIVMRHGKKYILRVNNLEVMIDELKKDIERSWRDLREVAQEIDNVLGLK
jgi:predicted transcriptional regulator